MTVTNLPTALPRPMLTTLVRTWAHDAALPCEQPGRTHQLPWRRVHGNAEDVTDPAAAEARAEGWRARATVAPDQHGRCSHVEVRVAPSAMNPSRGSDRVKRADAEVLSRLGLGGS